MSGAKLAEVSVVKKISMLLGGHFHSGAPRLCLPCLTTRDATVCVWTPDDICDVGLPTFLGIGHPYLLSHQKSVTLCNEVCAHYTPVLRGLHFNDKQNEPLYLFSLLRRRRGRPATAEHRSRRLRFDAPVSDDFAGFVSVVCCS